MKENISSNFNKLINCFQAEAVELIKTGKAPKIPQTEIGASYEAPITIKPELAQLDWSLNQRDAHNFIRGNDSVKKFTIVQYYIITII